MRARSRWITPSCSGSSVRGDGGLAGRSHVKIRAGTLQHLADTEQEHDYCGRSVFAVHSHARSAFTETVLLLGAQIGQVAGGVVFLNVPEAGGATLTGTWEEGNGREGRERCEQGDSFLASSSLCWEDCNLLKSEVRDVIGKSPYRVR